MKLFSALSLSLLALATAAHAAPSLTGSDPGGFVADAPSYPQGQSMTLSGSGLALPTTTGFTIEQDVSVWAKWSDGPWVRASNTGPWLRWGTWSPTSDGITFMGLDHPGTITTAVCVPDVNHCAFRDITVRARATAAPVLSQPNGLTVYSQTASQTVVFGATNLNDRETMCVYVEGSGSVPITRLDAFDGWGYVSLPSKPVGDYRVWVSNLSSCSGNWSNSGLLHVIYKK